MTRQLPLFDDDEATGTTVVRIAASDDAPALTKSQKSFNTLITRIESLRDSLARWQAFLPEFQRRLTHELLPLQERIDAQRSAGLHALDAAYRDPRLTKRERGKVQALIVTGTRDLLTRIDDAGLVALHDRHSRSVSNVSGSFHAGPSPPLSCPLIARRRAFPRPRVECRSSSVALKLGHMAPTAVLRHTPGPLQVSSAC